jgi:hypothetical protein
MASTTEMESKANGGQIQRCYIQNVVISCQKNEDEAQGLCFVYAIPK